MDGNSVMDVEAWLRGLGLGDYAPAFRANHIGPELLAELTGEDLIELGVASLGHRKLILRAAAELAATPPVAAATAPAEREGERRPVTVLFVDLSGYTALSRRVDPESLHGLLQRFFALADRIVTDHGGYVDKHVGDSVMAVFGAPIAHGNDAERAARAALAVLREVGELRAPDGSPVTAHAGMAYGEVVAAPTGSETHTAYTVTGDTVNLAARLTGLAGAGEIALSDSIRRLLPGDLPIGPGGTRAVKGLAAPVDYFLLSAPQAGGPVPATAPRGRFVGRLAEIAQVRALAGAVAAGRRSLHAHLRGEAGIGKSRIVEEVTAWARGEGFGTTAVGFLDFGVEEGRDALQMIARALHDPAAGIDPVHAPFARDLTGGAATADDRAALSVMDPAARVAGRAATLAAMLTARAAAAPQLIAIEDLHWASPAQRELLAAFLAASASVRCFFLTTSRQEGDPCFA
ncbi:MAG: adenylate/guanylate cyclase domain-containing protein, partial [Paracoccaceae bacterium]